MKNLWVIILILVLPSVSKSQEYVYYPSGVYADIYFPKTRVVIEGTGPDKKLGDYVKLEDGYDEIFVKFKELINYGDEKKCTLEMALIHIKKRDFYIKISYLKKELYPNKKKIVFYIGDESKVVPISYEKPNE